MKILTAKEDLSAKQRSVNLLKDAKLMNNANLATFVAQNVAIRFVQKMVIHAKDILNVYKMNFATVKEETSVCVQRLVFRGSAFMILIVCTTMNAT